MIVKIDTSPLRDTRWHEYVMRFVFGGAVTVGAGLLAQRYGPAIGGLFLAFPAIFPASATLIEKHEREKKESCESTGKRGGRYAAGLDAIGAAMGSVGLILFAVFARISIPHHPTWIALAGSTFLWLITSIGLWNVRQRQRKWSRRSRTAEKKREQ